MFVPPRPALAEDRAMLVGDPVAFIVAESVDLAKDAAERITVEYELLLSVTATEKALSPGAPKLWAECHDNECFFFSLGDQRAVEVAFAQAHHVSRLKLVFNRVTAATMEPRGCIGDWDDRLGRFTLYVGTQRPHTARADMARRILHIAETQLRVVAGEVGGSFGMKGGHYPEYALALWASRKIGRPVKWIAERSEGLLTDDHDRDHVSEAELALDRDGHFLALRARNISTSAPIWLRAASSRRPCIWAGSPAPTPHPPSTSRCQPSSQTRPASVPIAARDGPRRPTSSSG
jgi:carbon-monoxide dehydrogenase large subunit